MLYRVEGDHREYTHQPLERKVFYIEAPNFNKLAIKCKKIFQNVYEIQELEGHLWDDEYLPKS